MTNKATKAGMRHVDATNCSHQDIPWMKTSYILYLGFNYLEAWLDSILICSNLNAQFVPVGIVCRRMYMVYKAKIFLDLVCSSPLKTTVIDERHGDDDMTIKVANVWG